MEVKTKKTDGFLVLIWTSEVKKLVIVCKPREYVSHNEVMHTIIVLMTAFGKIRLRLMTAM